MRRSDILIMKMSQLHFVSTEEYRRRQDKQWENKWMYITWGVLGVENVKTSDC